MPDLEDQFPNQWIDQIFEAQQADAGGIVRRSRRDVERLASFEMLLTEVKRRGFHLIETGDQFVVFCHEGAMKIHC